MTGVNPAVWEIAGHMVMKRREDYDNLTQDFAWRLLAEVSLDEQEFMDVAHMCFGRRSSIDVCNDVEGHAPTSEAAAAGRIPACV